MTRFFTAMLMGGWLASSLGCAMCNQCGDECYTFYGGSVPRTHYCQGRVGSAFDSAGDAVSYEEEYAAEEFSEEEIYEEEAAREEEQDLAIPLDALPPAAQEPMSNDTSANELFSDEEEYQVSTEAEQDLPPVSKSTKNTPSRTRGKAPRLNQQRYLP